MERIDQRRFSKPLKHYYGDEMRILFFLAAVALGLSVPFSLNATLGLTLSIPAILVLVVLAGLTNPHGRIVMILNCVVSVAAILGAELFAVLAFQSQIYYLFLPLQAAAIIFIVALYFGVRTLRAMMGHRIGKIDGVGEFDSD